MSEDQTERLYNVTVRVVDLLWAKSPKEAADKLAIAVVSALDVDVLPTAEGDVIVSEAVESEGWDGEKRIPIPND